MSAQQNDNDALERERAGPADDRCRKLPYSVDCQRHVIFTQTGETLTTATAGFTQPQADMIVGLMNLVYIQGRWDQAHDEIERQKELYL